MKSTGGMKGGCQSWVQGPLFDSGTIIQRPVCTFRWPLCTFSWPLCTFTDLFAPSATSLHLHRPLCSLLCLLFSTIHGIFYRYSACLNLWKRPLCLWSVVISHDWYPSHTPPLPRLFRSPHPPLFRSLPRLFCSLCLSLSLLLSLSLSGFTPWSPLLPPSPSSVVSLVGVVAAAVGAVPAGVCSEEEGVVCGVELWHPVSRYQEGGQVKQVHKHLITVAGGNNTNKAL